MAFKDRTVAYFRNLKRRNRTQFGSGAVTTRRRGYESGGYLSRSDAIAIYASTGCWISEETDDDSNS